MSKSASIATFDMQGGSCSNINLQTRVMKWLDNCMITPLKLCLDNELKYVFTTFSSSDHANSNPGNSCQA